MTDIDTKHCAIHAGEIHGGEAEELRSGVERLLESASHTGGHDARLVLIDLRRGLRSLLDRVDARDSLAHLDLVASLRRDLLATTSALASAVEIAERLIRDLVYDEKADDWETLCALAKVGQ